VCHEQRCYFSARLRRNTRAAGRVTIAVCQAEGVAREGLEGAL
jgi:hypothetical protein